MEEALTWTKWSDSIPWLSHHKGEIACFWCPRCGKRKNYDVNSMLKVLGDIGVRSLADSAIDKLTAWYEKEIA